ncbi:hypothetical protein F383_26853 [Gossypium arboreum]|nr:hypothetical protein F383_26853 [Gossypium arboreum]
MCVARA